ncbi:MAG TPA: hypothetical protein PKO06_13985 [Candidatus Ozemobacteraceae bacterium]|nr:hypothetical protein [Candidatus Ozemobacteraceae bacterium]
MQPGEVVRWANFPFQKEGPKKARWLICFGTVKFYGQETQVYLATTTTKLEYYQPGGKRRNQPHYLIKKSLAPTFDADCVIDFMLDAPQPFLESCLTRANQDIESKGVLSNPVMSEMFSALVKSECVPPKILRELRSSLEVCGYKNLAKVK